MTSIPKAVTPGRLCFAVCLALCLLADFFLARLLWPNSDSTQAYNQMLAVRAGNHLLQHWTVTTDNFVLTDLVPMLLASLLLGPGERLIYLVPFAIFCALLAACLLLVRKVVPTHTGRLAGAYAVLLLLGVPYSLLYNFFFWNDFHIATVTACLYAVLLIEPSLSGDRFPRWRLLPFAALVFAATFSDPVADMLLVGPLVLLTIARAWLHRTFRPDEWLSAAGAVMSAAAAALAVHLLAGTGLSFRTVMNVTLAFVPNVTVLLRNLHAVLSGEQVLFSARAVLLHTLPLHLLVATTRQLTALAVAALSLAIVWRMPREPRAGASQLLVLGAACFSAIAAVSDTFSIAVSTGPEFPGAAVRYAVPQFVFLCLAAALRFGTIASRAPAGRPGRLLAAACALALAVPHAGAASVAAFRAATTKPGIRLCPDARLAQWLQSHGYRNGVGDYWDTQLVGALTAGAVLANPVYNVSGRLQPYPWLMDTSRFARRPDFVIIRPGGTFHVDLASIKATYGTPTAITKVANQFFVARLSPEPRNPEPRNPEPRPGHDAQDGAVRPARPPGSPPAARPPAPPPAAAHPRAAR